MSDNFKEETFITEDVEWLSASLYFSKKIKSLEERIKSLESSLMNAKDRAITAEEMIRKIERALSE